MSPYTIALSALGLNAISTSSRHGEMLIRDYNGKLIRRIAVQISRGDNYIGLTIGPLPAGLFMVTYQDEERMLGPLRLVKVK